MRNMDLYRKRLEKHRMRRKAHRLGLLKFGDYFAPRKIKEPTMEEMLIGLGLKAGGIIK